MAAWQDGDEDEESITWLRDHGLGELVDRALTQLLRDKPQNPHLWLAKEIAKGGRPDIPRPASEGNADAPPVQFAYRVEHSAVLQEYFSLMKPPLDPATDPAVVGTEERQKGQPFTFDIGAQDCLMVIDMQNDFIPKGPFNENGGRLPALEGDTICTPIADLMVHFGQKGGTVVATRDYHPHDHCSFMGHGGALPAHCVGGHAGSEFHFAITQKLNQLMSDERTKDNVVICFKGYNEAIDSFGGFTYSKEAAEERGKREGMHALPVNVQKSEEYDQGDGALHGAMLTGSSTGCKVLKCSATNIDGLLNANAPPDILSFARSGDKKLEDLLLKEKKLKRLFVCGLVFDYCVLDSACNGRRIGFDEVYLIADAARPAYLPKSDFFTPPFGSGFHQDPNAVKNKLVEEARGKFAFVGDILGTGDAATPVAGGGGGAAAAAGGGQRRIGEDFPSRLNPWRTQAVPRLVDFGSFRVTQPPTSSAPGAFAIDAAADPGFVALRTLGVDSSGVLGPISEVNFPASARAALGIPSAATQYCFIHPLDGADALAADARYAWCLHDPTFTLLILGGFAYFSASGAVEAVLALTGAGAGAHSVGWDAPRRWAREQLPPVTLHSCSRGTALSKNGARRFCWLANGQLECEYGGLLFEVDRGGEAPEYLTFSVFKDG